MRTAFAIISGVIAGGLVVAGVEALGHMLFPPPDGLDLADPELTAEMIDSLPIGTLASVVTAWFFGALVGGAVAGKIARYQWQPASVTVGAFLLFAGGIIMLQITPPLWMWIVGVVLPMPTAWFGAHLTHNLVPPSR